MFGLSTPLAKLLVGRVPPIPMAALLYLGAGLGIASFKGARRLTGRRQAEAPLAGGDLPWLVGAVLAGGVAAPIVLMLSLQRTPAATAPPGGGGPVRRKAHRGRRGKGTFFRCARNAVGGGGRGRTPA